MSGPVFVAPATPWGAPAPSVPTSEPAPSFIGTPAAGWAKPTAQAPAAAPSVAAWHKPNPNAPPQHMMEAKADTPVTPRAPNFPPNPDRNLLGNGQTTAPPLPFGSFGRFAGLLENLAQGASAPVDYVAFAMLTCASALVGNARPVMPDPQGTEWTEPLAMWTCLVGPPSSGKTPAQAPFLKLLEKIQEDDAKAFAPRMAEHEAKREAAKVANAEWKKAVAEAHGSGRPPPAMPSEAVIPPKAMAPRSYTNVATIEALIELLSSNPNGLLQIRDELAGWIGDMTRYSNSSDRPYWLSMYNGQSIMLDRVKFSGEPMHVPNALMSVLGGIQPDRLKESLNTADDGFLARFLFIWPDPVPLTRSVGRADTSIIGVMFDRLRSLRITPWSMTFTPEAADAFFAFRQHARKLEGETSGLVQGWIGKGNGVVARLATILTLLDWAYEGPGAAPITVQAEAVHRAGTLWADYLLPMAKRAFGDASRPLVEKNAMALLKEIQRRGGCAFINNRVVYREWKLSGLREAKDVQAALSYLNEAGWVSPKYDNNLKTGRPLSDWWINPALFQH